MNEIRIVVGYEGDFAPLTFVEGGQARGLVIDLLSEAFDRIGVGADFVTVPLPEHEEAIRSGKIDTVAFKAITPERQRDYDFSIPITTTGAAWFASASKPVEGSRPLSGSRLTTPAAGPLIAQLRRNFPDCSFVDVNSYAEALNAVIDGKADYAALNFHMGCYLANRDHAGRFHLPDAPFQQMAIGFALAKGSNADFLVRFNRALNEMHSAGMVEAVERRWLTGSGAINDTQ